MTSPRLRLPDAENARIVGTVQRDVERALTSLFADARELSVTKGQAVPPTGRITLTTSGTRTLDIPLAVSREHLIPHGLGRPWRGVLVVAQTDQNYPVASLRPSQASSTYDDSIYVCVKPGAVMTARLVVY